MSRPLPRSFAPGIVRRAFAHGSVLVISQSLTDAAAPPPPDGVIIEPFTSLDWSPLAPIATGAELRQFQRRALARRTCLVAWRGRRPVGYTWVSQVAESGLEGFHLDLPVGACYGWNLFVEPGSRRTGIGSALAGARLLWAQADGYTAMWRVVAPHNTASLRTVARTAGAGAVVLGELRYVRVLHWFRGRLTAAPADLPALTTIPPRAGMAA